MDNNTDTHASNPNSFYMRLMQLGEPRDDAQIIDQAFRDEDIDAFIDDLEKIAFCLGTKTPLTNLEPPTSAPWREIWTGMVNAIDSKKTSQLIEAFSIAMEPFYDNGLLQMALTNLVSHRMGIAEKFEQEKGQRKHVKTKDYVKALKDIGYGFRLNACNDKIEVNGKQLTDTMAAKIRTQMRDAGFYRIYEMEDAYWAEAWSNQYHPIMEYLNSLSWDGTERISELSDHFQDKYGMFPTWLRKWLIGACAKVFQAEQNPMLVIDGPQGIGKSEFVKWLAKPCMDYFVEAPINPSDKDTEIRLISFWIWEVSELGATTRKADYEALKAFLTTRKVTVRKPYGKHDISKPALASFIGTINNSSGIFSDPTGSRRFMVSHITDIDWNYSVSFDPRDIWAEAMAAYRSGEKWLLDADESTKANEINDFYGVADPIEDLIQKHFELDINHSDWWMATSDILDILQDPLKGNLKGHTRGNAMGVAVAMTKMGHDKTKNKNIIGQRVWGYTGIRLPNFLP